MRVEELAERIIDYRGKTPPKTSAGVPLITAKVIKGGRIVQTSEYISEETYGSWMRRGFPQQWDMLVTTEAPLGEVALLRTPERIALAQRVILVRGREDIVDRRFLAYCFQSPLVQGRLQARATGTTVLGIKQSELAPGRCALAAYWCTAEDRGGVGDTLGGGLGTPANLCGFGLAGAHVLMMVACATIITRVRKTQRRTRLGSRNLTRRTESLSRIALPLHDARLSTRCVSPPDYGRGVLSGGDMQRGAEALPNQFDLMWPTLTAIKDLGGSATISEIVEHVIKSQAFTEEQQAVKRRPGDHMSAIEYRLAWARNGLKLIGAIENSTRGVWSITERGRAFSSSAEVVATSKQWRAQYNKEYQARKRLGTPVSAEAEEDDEAVEPEWQDALLDRLLRMSPGAFERLAQRLLREADFRDVTVLGKSGDGGIDGVGDLRISLVSFPVYFQCKRYRSAVGASDVRDFRGAMAGRGEKGLLITTSSFTREARQEATRDGAPPIELVSGLELADLLRKYEIGVHTIQRVVEEVSVDEQFFDQFEP